MSNVLTVLVGPSWGVGMAPGKAVPLKVGVGRKLTTGVAAFRTIHSYAFNMGLVSEIRTEVTGDGGTT